ncbi:MAG: DUF805 domain-containing protein [Sphingomicrobium sp.]
MASPTSPIEYTLLPLKRYAQFSGRSGRAEFWWFTLVTTAAGLFLDFIDRAMGSEYGLLGVIFTLGLFIPSLSVSVRRLHDIGISGWWMLAVIAPAMFFGMMSSFAALETEFNGGSAASPSLLWISLLVIACLAMVVVLVLPGTKGQNKYGEDPYAGGAVRAV